MDPGMNELHYKDHLGVRVYAIVPSLYSTIRNACYHIALQRMNGGR